MMSFEFTAKQNYPDYTGYKCMVKKHLTLEVVVTLTFLYGFRPLFIVLTSRSSG